jgi:hypothetical protein
MGWVGHTAGMEERVDTYRFVVAKPGGKRTLDQLRKY